VSINEIKQALPGERVLGLSPEDATAAATDWLRRPNLFPGRALTAPTLENRQHWQAGRIAQRGQAFTPGVVTGLEVAHRAEPDGSDIPPVRVMVEPGQGLAVSGEDVFLVRRLEFMLSELPVVAPQDWFIAQQPEEVEPDPLPPAEDDLDTPTNVLQPRIIGGRLADVIGTAGERMSQVGVLVLQPVTVDVASLDPNDPCDRCAFGEEENLSAFEDWRIGDGVRVLWYPWPEEWRTLPFTQLRRRNAVAHTIFTAEATLAHGECLPWEQYGVPIALVGITDTVQITYIDRAAVVRQGGRAREARLQLLYGGSVAALTASSRLPALWQARIEQFAEQLAEQFAANSGATETDPQSLADPFLHLPPCGLLPTAALRLKDFQSDFFPPLFTLDAVPVPLEQLDLAIREAAPMAPLDIGVPERVRLLVPVSQASWEPRLLHRDVIDPEFQQTLNRFLLDRARGLGARQGMRSKAALLAHAVDGELHEVLPFDQDPLALELEALEPWGPPPDSGGHRSSLLAGLHRHAFEGTSNKLIPAAGEALFAWVYLDPEHPPRTLMLEWHTAKTGWEQRVYLGENLIELGTDESTSRLRIGTLPTAGAWIRISIGADKLGLVGQEIDGMAFTLYDGRAAFGQTGAIGKEVQRNWFSNFIPPEAKLQGNESWDLLTHNDLWGPFERDGGVTASLPDVVFSGGGAFLDEEGAEASAQLALPNSPFSIYYALASGWRGHLLTYPQTHPGIFPSGNGNDALSIWVYLDELTPPRSIWAFLTGTATDGDGFTQRVAFWGENHLAELNRVIPGISFVAPQTLRAGALPQTGGWTRLVLPQPTIARPVGMRVGFVALFAFGGSIAFSDMTIVTSSTTDQDIPLWPLDPGAQQPSPAFTPWQDAKPQLQDALNKLAPTPSGRIGTVQVMDDLVNDTRIAQLSAHERSQVQLRGVQGFADYLRRRIDRADDITDFGFAHMQVDMARIRNMLLSTSDAGRLAISPALSAIAKSDSALNVQSQIKEYLAGVKAAAKPQSSATRTTSSTVTVTAKTATSSVSSLQSTKVSSARLIQKPNAALDIVYSRPVIGLSEVRTTAIAERLKQPPSTEARDYALSNRQRTVSSLLDLLNAFIVEDSGEVPGLLEDFDIPGLANDPFLVGAVGGKRKLTDFRNSSELLGKLLQPPPLLKDASNRDIPEDEAVLFTQTVALSDNTVAMLRQLEGRLTIYREALVRCEQALDDLQADVAAVSQRLRQLEAVLAEARHDVGVARALSTEEQARIDGVNARRAQVLAEEVKFLAYARPRETTSVVAAPRRAVDPALAEAPVPACLRDHNDVPDELEDMLKVVREAPAAWFIQVPKLLDKLDRSDLLLRTVKSAQLRLPQVAARAPVALPVAGKLGTTVTQVLARQGTLLAGRLETLNRVNFEVLAAGTWQNLRTQAQEIVSLGDIIDGEHGKGAVTREAAAEFDRIAAVCGCLHAELCGVSAAIRLDWAELFSQFDAAPDLHELGNLPRWAEIDSIDRRQMQAYADWLFAQLEPKQPQGVALINDVIRMCLLLASHAPVGRIITGRLPRPVTAVRPGIRIPLVALEPAKLRVGMQALLYRQQSVIARAVVEDIGSGEVSARVLHTSAAQIDLDVEVRVHFDHAAAVSAAPARSGSVFKR
jgi:hypothetical protein